MEKPEPRLPNWMTADDSMDENWQVSSTSHFNTTRPEDKRSLDNEQSIIWNLSRQLLINHLHDSNDNDVHNDDDDDDDDDDYDHEDDDDDNFKEIDDDYDDDDYDDEDDNKAHNSKFSENNFLVTNFLWSVLCHMSV